MHRRFLGLDYSFRPLNQLFKYVKLGFGMETDLACYDLREGLISYDEAVFLVKELDGKCSEKIIADFCAYLDISLHDFWSHVNSFRGNMWKKRRDAWVLDNPIWEQRPLPHNLSVADICKRLGM